jgi:hypothetical protein
VQSLIKTIHIRADLADLAFLELYLHPFLALFLHPFLELFLHLFLELLLCQFLDLHPFLELLLCQFFNQFLALFSATISFLGQGYANCNASNQMLWLIKAC